MQRQKTKPEYSINAMVQAQLERGEAFLARVVAEAGRTGLPVTIHNIDGDLVMTVSAGGAS